MAATEHRNLCWGDTFWSAGQYGSGAWTGVDKFWLHVTDDSTVVEFDGDLKDARSIVTFLAEMLDLTIVDTENKWAA